MLATANGSGHARGFQSCRRRRQASRPSRSDDRPRDAALRDVFSADERLSGAHRRRLRFPHAETSARKSSKKLSKAGSTSSSAPHRLLSKDVAFKDLGLLIVDEEQRFGVKAKEHLKKFKAGVDCLTLSRLRSRALSICRLCTRGTCRSSAPPPQDRLPIKTIIAEDRSGIDPKRLQRELSRGGQAFYIHNRVESIYTHADRLRKLAPAARVDVVHGQMDADDVDSIFHRFRQGELDVAPRDYHRRKWDRCANGNTILIDRADTYGLADLYQLRGRVGRWNRAAYADFLIPKNARLPEPARKRSTPSSNRAAMAAE